VHATRAPVCRIIDRAHAVFFESRASSRGDVVAFMVYYNKLIDFCNVVFSASGAAYYVVLLFSACHTRRCFTIVQRCMAVETPAWKSVR
jgi:hypothetical protein